MKEGNTTVSPFWREMFTLAVYKRSQGRIARQVTFAVLAVALVLGSIALWYFMSDWGRSVQSTVAQWAAEGGWSRHFRVLVIIPPQTTIAVVVALGGVWICYRVVNLPRFADFLIAVEAEMNKVSWPSRVELVRSSLVVLVTMFGLAATLFAYDLIWQRVLLMLGVLQGA